MTREKIRRYNELFTGHLLDVGAGNKPYASLFKNVAVYSGTNTRRYYGAEELAILEPLTDYWIEDASSLPLDDNSFESVVCFQVLPVLKEPGRFFAEASRILKPDGYLMVTSDFLYPKWSVEDRQRFTDFTLREMAEANGLKIVACESYGGVLTTLHCLLMRYSRDYLHILSLRSNILGKFLGAIVYSICLILMPLFSAVGVFIYFMEKDNHKAFEFTANVFILAKKTKNVYNS